MFKINVNLNKDNDKLDKIIVVLKDYVWFLKDINKILDENNANIKN